ncbi:VOC family protein [Sinimarinibacterium sp. CAU 1509]|uniref:VOC family protein n=1 Tax=Sinimarinibacterium sp. CAU 1509 TaxID=2562283 RepID=UPI0010AD77B8|nr:VOC family protein [Sinimarinibacterium sp. CAU 1509]TJY59038.1 VOC family protein [Sinimarinibacterium sp. CAU 1509]
MHKSKLAGFIIDCKTDDLPAASAFWAGALGMQRRGLDGSEGENYVWLMDTQHGLHLEVQAVTHDSRIHMDIETDDIEAEVQRLEALGAKRFQQFPRWWVMEAPTGQRFCVVRAQSPDFERLATQWP